MTGPPWQSYDSVAREYDRAWHPSFEPVARDLLELVALEPHEAMLDVGTGTGVVAAAAAERVALADMVRALRSGGRLAVTAWGTLDDEPVDDGQQRQLTGIWTSVAGRFVDIDAASEVIVAAIPWEAWFGDPAHLRAALEGGGLRSVDLRSRTYRRCVSQRDALAASETSFWGRYLRNALGDPEWARFRREVADAAAAALPDPITRVDQLLIGVGTKRFETRP